MTLRRVPAGPSRLLRLFGLAWLIGLLRRLFRRRETQERDDASALPEQGYFLPCSLPGRELTANGGLREGSDLVPQPPRNYGDWRHLLEESDRCSTDLAQVLRHGEIPEGAVPQVFELIRCFCERSINHEGRRLSQGLEEIAGNDADGIIMLCTRYSYACARLLFFADVQGMPQHEGGQLATQIREHVVGVLHGVAAGIGNGGGNGEGTAGGASPETDDTAYAITRLERRWMRA